MPECDYNRKMTIDGKNRGIDDRRLECMLDFVGDDTITECDISGNQITDTGLLTFANYMYQNGQNQIGSLNISYNPKLSQCSLDTLMQILKNSPHLASLAMAQLEGFSSDAWGRFCYILWDIRPDNLRELSLSKNSCINSRIFVDLILSLQYFPNLETLDVSACRLGDELFTLLEKVQPLTKTFQLKKLVLSDNPIGNRAMASLLRWLNKGLVHVEIASTGLTSDGDAEVFDALRAHSNLQILNVSTNTISMKNLVEKLFTDLNAEKRGVTTLIAKDCSLDRLSITSLFDIKTLTYLKELDLSDNNVLSNGDFFANSICSQFIATSQALEKLTLDHCNLQPEHVECFAQALLENSQSKLTNISWNKNSTAEAGCHHWRKVMQRLYSLSLIDNGIDAKGGGILLCALWDDRFSGKIEHLYLAGSTVTSPCANKLKLDDLRDIALFLKTREDENYRRRIKTMPRVQKQETMPREQQQQVQNQIWLQQKRLWQQQQQQQIWQQLQQLNPHLPPEQIFVLYQQRLQELQQLNPHLPLEQIFALYQRELQFMQQQAMQLMQQQAMQLMQQQVMQPMQQQVMICQQQPGQQFTRLGYPVQQGCPPQLPYMGGSPLDTYQPQTPRPYYNAQGYYSQ